MHETVDKMLIDLCLAGYDVILSVDSLDIYTAWADPAANDEEGIRVRAESPIAAIVKLHRAAIAKAKGGDNATP